MPEITVTESQRERLSTVQSDIEAAYIDTYGHVRLEDTIEYLLDTYTPPEEQSQDADLERIATAEYQLLQEIATDVEGVPGSGIDTETMRGELLSTLGVTEFASRLAELDVANDSDPDTDMGDTGSEDNGTDDAAVTEDGDDTAGGQSEQATPHAESDDESAAQSEEDTVDDTSSPDAGASPATDGPGSVLSAANQLLTDHDDKWREGGADEPYEVDLPDGSTETVRTKDDVRGLLFKHY